MSTRVGSHVIGAGGTHVFAHQTSTPVGFATPAVIDYGGGMGGAGGWAADPNNIFASQVGGATVGQQAILDALEQGDTWQINYQDSEFTFVEADGLAVVVDDSGAPAAPGDYVIPIQIHDLSLDTVIDSSFTLTVAAPIAPILSAIGTTDVQQTTVDVFFDTNKAGGTAYVYISESATPPSIADLKSGSGSVASSNQSVSAIGTQTFDDVSALSDDTSYYAHAIQTDSDTLDSNIETSAQFTTPLAPDITAPIIGPITVDDITKVSADVSFDTDEDNGTAYVYISESATPPSIADLKSGSGSVNSDSKAVSAAGTISFNDLPALTAGTNYYAHSIHTDAALNDSNIRTSTQFSTLALTPPVQTVAFPTLDWMVGVAITPLVMADYFDPDGDTYEQILGTLPAGVSFDGLQVAGTPTVVAGDDIQFSATNEDGSVDSSVVAFAVAAQATIDPIAFTPDYDSPLSSAQSDTQPITGLLDSDPITATSEAGLIEVSNDNGSSWGSSTTYVDGLTLVRASVTTGVRYSDSYYATGTINGAEVSYFARTIVDPAPSSAKRGVVNVYATPGRSGGIARP